MRNFEIANPRKDPQCAECGCMMWLYVVEPRKMGYEERTFKCPRCHHVDGAVVEVV